MADKHIDCKELTCPMPIVRISEAIKEMSLGQTLSVEATDMAFKADLKAWVQKMGYEIVELTNNGPVHQAIIRKCG